MPSRKRAKGKARKAKAADRHWANVEQYHWKGWVLWDKEENNKSLTCNHGHNTIYPADSHPVYQFIDKLFVFDEKERHLLVNEEFERAGEGLWSLLEYVKQSYANHPTVWNNVEHRKMAMDILLSIGTNILERGAGSGGARVLANGCLLLEAFAFIQSKLDSVNDPALIATWDVNTNLDLAVYSALSSIRDLAGGKDRAVIRFFHKRLSCDCLKAKYAQSKRMEQKIGVCNTCRQTYLRMDLKICGVCRIGQYCSSECQSQAWKDHQDECKFLNLGRESVAWLTTQEEDVREVRRTKLIMKCNAIVSAKAKEQQ